VKALSTKFVTLTTTAPPTADQNESTRNPSTSRPTSKNNKALITTMPNPNVSKMKGSVNSTISGLRITLNKLSNTPTPSNVVPLSH
jgi:hypothetical protein